MRKNESVLLEYVSRLSDDDLHHLATFNQNIGGDRAEVASFVGHNKPMDRWLSSADSSNEWFDMIDFVVEHVRKEIKCREKAKSTAS